MDFIKLLKWGPSAWKHLNGLFCIYKPPGWTMYKTILNLQRRLLLDLNSLPNYEDEIDFYQKYPGWNLNELSRFVAYQYVTTPADKQQTSNSRQEESGFKDGYSTDVGIYNEEQQKFSLTEKYPVQRLMYGPRFTAQDVKIGHCHSLGIWDSGVVVMSLGAGRAYLPILAAGKHIRVYHVKGQLGVATDNYHSQGKLLFQASFGHINRGKLDKACAQLQTSFQRTMFIDAGVDLKSQEAYEIASKGFIRSKMDSKQPVIYSVKCIDFKPPDFTLEIHTVNEDTLFLMKFVHDLGLRMRSTACCSAVRRIRHGYFTHDIALTHAEWSLVNILKNIQFCQRFLTEEAFLTGPSLEPLNEDLMKGLPGENNQRPTLNSPSSENLPSTTSKFSSSNCRSKSVQSSTDEAHPLLTALRKQVFVEKKGLLEEKIPISKSKSTQNVKRRNVSKNLWTENTQRLKSRQHLKTTNDNRFQNNLGSSHVHVTSRKNNKKESSIDKDLEELSWKM